jgi:hypothetical protein
MRASFMPQNQIQLDYTQPLYAMTLDAALMSDIENDAKGLGEKMKDKTKAAGEKISDTGKDMGAEAGKAKDKVKEKVD